MNITGRSRQRRSAEEIERLVNEYRAAELTQKTYAEQIGVKLCTLRTWIYKRKGAPVLGGFAAVRLEDGAVTGRDVLTVRWPAGVELELPVSLGEAALRGVLRELLAPCLRYVHVDATPVDVCDPGRPGRVREATLWAYCAKQGAVWFDYQPAPPTRERHRVKLRSPAELRLRQTNRSPKTAPRTPAAVAA